MLVSAEPAPLEIYTQLVVVLQGLAGQYGGLLRLPSEVDPDDADDRHFQQRYRRIAHEANHQHTE